MSALAIRLSDFGTVRATLDVDNIVRAIADAARCGGRNPLCSTISCVDRRRVDGSVRGLVVFIHESLVRDINAIVDRINATSDEITAHVTSDAHPHNGRCFELELIPRET